jgi:hypothetical protein
VPSWLLPPEWAARQAAAESLRAIPSLEGDALATRTHAFAEALAAEGDCERAVTEYLRAAHLEGGADAQARARRRIGDAWLAAGEWGRAEASYLAAAMIAGVESGAGADRALAACSRFNAGDAAGAERLALAGDPSDSGGVDAERVAMAGVPSVTASAAVSPRTLGLLGLLAMRRGAWPDAEQRLAAGIRASEESAGRWPAADLPSEGWIARDPVLGSRLRALSAAAASGPDLPRKSARLASVLSAILPGSGQVYAGRASDGLRHLLMDATLGWTIVSLARDRNLPATVLVTSFSVPFYFGNVFGAGNAARAFNRERRIAHIAAALARAEAEGRASR